MQLIVARERCGAKSNTYMLSSSIQVALLCLMMKTMMQCCNERAPQQKYPSRSYFKATRTATSCDNRLRVDHSDQFWLLLWAGSSLFLARCAVPYSTKGLLQRLPRTCAKRACHSRSGAVREAENQAGSTRHTRRQPGAKGHSQDTRPAALRPQRSGHQAGIRSSL